MKGTAKERIKENPRRCRFFEKDGYIIFILSLCYEMGYEMFYGTIKWTGDINAIKSYVAGMLKTTNFHLEIEF